MSVFDPTESKQPHRQPSFVGLPPISPGPEFGSVLGISTADFDAVVYDGRRNSPSPPAQSSSPHPSSHLNGRGGNHHNGSGPVSIMNQFHSNSPPPQGIFMQGQYVVMQGQHQLTNQYPPGAQFNVNVNGMHQQPGSPPPGHDGQPGVFMTRQAMKAPVGQQQVAFPPGGSPPGMPSPSMMSNGQFAPPPGWKMESSQLQQPLTTQRHRPSPSISSLRQQNQSYEIDKETGLSTRSVSPPTQSPIETRRPGQPALVQSAGQSSQQNGFQPPNPPFAQQQHQQQSPTLARTSTNLTQDSQYHDEHDGRRTSNMFSSIRSRLAGNGTDRRDSMGSRPQGTGVTEDGVSEASIPIEGQGRGAAKFFGLTGNGQPASEGTPRQSHDMRGSSPPPVGGAPFSPPREKRSFFTRPSGPGTGTQSAQELRRPSTAEGATGQAPIVGFGPGQPRKRFSKLTGMLNRDNKTETQLSQPTGQPSYVQRPSFQGQRAMAPGGPMGPPGQLGPPGGPAGEPLMSEFGRPRSATAGAAARPSISDHSRSPSAQGLGSPPPMGAIREEERGRKPSGNFLAGIFGKRSESKTREQRPPQSPPGLGQPQSMNPQGQMMIMHRPGQSGSFLPIQGQTLNMQGQPMAPPQGQYAGLINQAQQYMGQPGRQGTPNNQAFMQGQNPAQFGVNQQRQQSPGISPVTQSSGSPMATQPQGGMPGRQPPVTQQGQQGYIPQRPQEQPPTLGIVQVATAVPIRQVSNSPNGNTGQISAGPSPGGQSDSSRQRSASVVNQIEVGGNRKQTVDVQGTRSRAASQSVPQQSPVHIASLQALTRKPINSTSPRNSGQMVDPNQIDDNTVSAGQRTGTTPPQDSPQNRRVSQGLGQAQQQQHHQQSSNQQQSVSLQSTPRESPAPNPEQQAGPPGVPPKNSPAPNPGHGLGLSQPQPWQNPGGTGQQSTISQQASVYRPSGPQIAAVVQSFSQQQPQSPWSIGRQNTGGQAGQQYPPVQSPQSLMMTPAAQDQRPEKEGAFSKLLGKSKTFVYQMSEPQPSSDKAKPEKESKGVKGMLGAFKRDKPKPQQQPEVGKAPPGGPQWNIQSAPAANMRAQNLKQQIAPHAPEPQYAPVPIPQGYVPVYGAGKPEMVRAPSYGQPYPGMVFQGHTQQWVFPGMLPGQVPQGVPPHMVQQGWPQYPPYQGTPPPMMMAQHPPPPQQYTQGQQASPPPMMQEQAPPPQMPMQQPPMHAQVVAPTTSQAQMVAPQQAIIPPHSAGFVPPQQGPPASAAQMQAMQAMQHNGQVIAPHSQQQFAVMPESPPAPGQMSNDGQPQSYTLDSTKPESYQSPHQAVPRSAFAVTKPLAGHDQLQPPQDPAGHLVPQRQLSGASEVSSLTSGPATSQGSTGAHSDHTVSQVHQPNGIPERNAGSPEPMYERPPVTLKDEGLRMETPVTSTSTEKDDIYGATPRQSAHVTPVKSQAQQNVERVSVPESTTQEHSGEPEVKFSGPPPNNRSPESKPTFRVEPPSQQEFVVDAPPVTGEPGTPSTIPGPDSAPPSSTLSTAAPPVQSSAEIFEEHKRKQLLRDMEEKIAIFPTEPEAPEPRKNSKKDDDAPMMSATSYPGQEWNPYGDGWVEDDL
ncbi:hypothetical protein VMCG_01740 [Cytospora schulzeri]|uniref:Uncharacterized protein n=1 Tax=Cytospora schulzeri TaxID=448051 RepID=A0A423X420_9PEZI|nr:hypothetical protein VMCG_01740 [Valsa malicola]